MRTTIQPPSSPIPLIGRIADHPSDPIACQVAVAHSAGQGRPHRGRKRLALDRSEYDGRLAAFGQEARCTLPPCSFRRIVVAGLVGVALMLPGVPGRAGPASTAASDGVVSEHQDASDPWASFIAEAAERFDIPERWIRTAMRTESDGDTHIVSPKGAMGLMQIMPTTWDELRARHGLGDDPFDPHDNIIAGTAYLRALRDRYGIPGALAAYSAGPARWEEHQLLGVPLPDATQRDLGKPAPAVDDTTPGLFVAPAWSTTGASDAPLFAIDTATRPAASAVPSERLFVTSRRPGTRPAPADSGGSNVQTE